MANSLYDLMSPLVATANELLLALSGVQGQINQLNPTLQSTATGLEKNSSASSGMDFSGLGAQSFQEAIRVHIKVTEFFNTAFHSLETELQDLSTGVDQTSWQYDLKLQTIQSTNYAPNNPSDMVAQGAREAFINLHPYSAMVTHILASASGEAVLQSGATHLLSSLNSAYWGLVALVEGEDIEIPFSTPPTFTNSTDAEQWSHQMAAEQYQARQMILASLNSMYTDISQVYSDWGTAVEQAFSKFQSALVSAEQQLQPAVDLLTNPNSAVSIFDLIHIISGQQTPIAITRVGPNRILVSISGTELNNMSFDTNIWNALGTGMGQDMPYEQDVIAAIQAYCAEHGLLNPEVILAGHSLGGMVAQQVADKGLFNVTQVVTYGSPVMGNPMPGVQYDMYAAQWDPVPMLSRYENPDLPASLQDVTQRFPNFRTDYHGFTNPFSWSGLKHDVGSIIHDTGATAENVVSGVQNVGSLGDVLVSGGNSYANMLTPGLKKNFMDPHHMYGNSVQIVPDLTSMSPGVHSDYGNSQWLENQKIYQNIPGSGFLSNTEYFGMPNMPQTAQIDEYMKTHSSVGQILSHYVPQ